MKEKYRKYVNNARVFKNLWGQWPRQIGNLRGSACLNRSDPFSCRVRADTLRVDENEDGDEESPASNPFKVFLNMES